MTEPFDNDDSAIPIYVRAQLLRDLITRLVELLAVHCQGYFMFYSDPVDEVYIRLQKNIKETLNSEGLETLYSLYPKSLPVSLHNLGDEFFEEWEYAFQPEINAFRGKLIEFCVAINAGYREFRPIFHLNIFKEYDDFIENYSEQKDKYTKNWLRKMEQQAEKSTIETDLPAIDWGFILDIKSRNYLIRDYQELQELQKIKALKSTSVLCGSILEATLVSVLTAIEEKARYKYYETFLKSRHPDKKAPPVNEWSLNESITVSHKLGILDDDEVRLAGIIKDYRNLIHPAVEYRRASNLDKDVISAILSLMKRMLKSLSSASTKMKS